MNAAALKKLIAASADPARVQEQLNQWPDQALKAFLTKATVKQAGALLAVLAGSDFLADSLEAHPEWLTVLHDQGLEQPRRAQGLRQEVAQSLRRKLDQRDYSGALGALRQFKQRELLRIAARDLARLADAVEITRELSDVADVCLDTVWQICRQQLEGRLGQPHHKDGTGRWVATSACVLGMGKLGGQELNYSSDVDVLFVYDEEGSVFRDPPTARRSPRALMTSHEFFNRLGESFINEVSRSTEEGFLYRIDLRLRPEGNNGPLTRALTSYENYYAQWGQTWERMMLIKARCVAGACDVAGEFLEMVQPFRFPRVISDSALREVATLKDRIEQEVVRAGEVHRNVKLGRGGIREIEFIVQSLQLLNAGRHPFLQSSQTLPSLAKLAQYSLLPEAEATHLSEAYLFLRDVEHRLQMEANLQTHTIPEVRPARERLARLMGFKTLKAFETELHRHQSFVRSAFERLLHQDEPPEDSDLPGEFAGHEPEWRTLLERHQFRDVDKALRTLREFVEGPGYGHVSPRTLTLSRQVLPRLLAFCPDSTAPPESDRFDRPVLSDPDRVVTRLDSYIAAYGARATLFELWARYPLVFESLMLVFDRSEFLAELAIRTPDFVDDLVVSGRLRQNKSVADTLRDLMHGLGDADQHQWIRTYQQAELMRLGVRDILDMVGPQQTLESISALAEACLQYAVAVLCKRHRLKQPPFAILGLGKLGGRELNYGSDLDIFFVAPDTTRQPDKLHRMAAEVMDLLSARTELGIAFVTDARLRPDGEKSPLVNTLSKHEDYYRQRAQLWEIQAISRTRFVAGDATVGQQFETLAARLANFASPSKPLAAFSKDWKDKMHAMRMRIEKERTPSGQDALAIKTGKGGLVDAEFVAQALCLAQGWHEPNTLAALERGQQAHVLPEADDLIVNYLRLRRVEGILRRWSYEGETVLPTEAEPYRRVSVRCGFTSPEAFRAALAEYRQAIRQAYAAWLQ
jgi:glutamate-ammonia-ligase adenylyltransferase